MGWRVLIAPLNWGLGHATRCLPIAAALRARGARIHWASDGAALALLRVECPGDAHHPLPTYGVRHASAHAVVNGLRLAPALLQGILAERRALAALHTEHDFAFILSDNRYGCYLPAVPGAVVCHQLHLPLHSVWLRWLPNAIHQGLLRRFDEVVVPDFAPPGGLAGAMSRPLGGVPVRYLGALSRFKYELDKSASTSPRYELVCLLSGPEPARSRFEARLLVALRHLSISPQRVALVRGRPSVTEDHNAPHIEAIIAAGAKVFDYLPAKKLAGVLAQADSIVTRPGYTTVMDLHTLGRPAIFAPTPGQPEQAVLAEALAASGRGVVLEETELDLAAALARLGSLPAELVPPHRPAGEQLADWVEHTLARIA